MNTEKLRELTVWHLASMINTFASPDTSESAGAEFLIGVRDDLCDDLDHLQSLGDWDEDRIHEIADAAVPVGTHKMWQTFIDLAAYHHSSAESADADAKDMSKQAAFVLFEIARELIELLLDELESGDFDNTESETDHDE